MAKLTILLPTHNSISRNGDGFLQDALTALQNQTFMDFELHILNNISTDNTTNICKQFADKDARIKFEVDNKQRFPETGIIKLIDGVKTEYIMIANCDNLWNHHYIESLLAVFKQYPNIALAYSNGTFIDKDNNEGDPLLKDTRFTYDNDTEHNFCLAIQHRSVVPLLFGIFKTEAYTHTLSYTPFDTINANADNLFLALFFLHGYRAQLCNSSLFHYRDRPHEIHTEEMPTNPTLIWVYHIQHQLKFYREVTNAIDGGTPLLKIATLDSCFRYLGPLLEWVICNLAQDTFEQNLLQTIYKKYTAIQNILFKTNYPEVDEYLYKNHYRKCNILSTQILPYISTILNPNQIITDTTQLIQEIQSEIL